MVPSPTDVAGSAPGGRLVLLSTSPRVASGLLSWDAWAALRDGDVIAVVDHHPLLPYLNAAGIRVDQVPHEGTPRALFARAAASERPVVVLLEPQYTETFSRELTEELITRSEAGPVPEVEVLPGSYDLPGAAFLDLVATMDRLRSPGGCPWDAEQTHESLTTYLLEEAYETIEAIETGDAEHLREELGDLLLQVVFHSRIAEEHGNSPWSIDDVVADIVAKLTRRHPHVFGQNAESPTVSDVEASWHTLKAAEKSRTSAVEGVPMGLPALALAATLMGRVRAQGLQVELTTEAERDGIGSRLMLLVAEAQSVGLDAEAELRSAVRRYAERVRDSER